jgi:hypothetical protein
VAFVGFNFLGEFLGGKNGKMRAILPFFAIAICGKRYAWFLFDFLLK